MKDVEGFDHSAVNEALGACGDLPTTEEGPCLPYYLWQCGDIKVKMPDFCKNIVKISIL